MFVQAHRLHSKRKQKMDESKHRIIKQVLNKQTKKNKIQIIKYIKNKTIKTNITTTNIFGQTIFYLYIKLL